MNMIYLQCVILFSCSTLVRIKELRIMTPCLLENIYWHPILRGVTSLKTWFFTFRTHILHYFSIERKVTVSVLFCSRCLIHPPEWSPAVMTLWQRWMAVVGLQDEGEEADDSGGGWGVDAVEGRETYHWFSRCWSSVKSAGRNVLPFLDTSRLQNRWLWWESQRWKRKSHLEWKTFKIAWTRRESYLWKLQFPEPIHRVSN